MSHKWTEGEIRKIVDDEDGRAAIEVLSELVGKGRHVIAWGDLSDPEAEAEERRNIELRAADEADGVV
jgi:hypothetical protein